MNISFRTCYQTRIQCNGWAVVFSFSDISINLKSWTKHSKSIECFNVSNVCFACVINMGELCQETEANFYCSIFCFNKQAIKCHLTVWCKQKEGERMMLSTESSWDNSVLLQEAVYTQGNTNTWWPRVYYIRSQTHRTPFYVRTLIDVYICLCLHVNMYELLCWVMCFEILYAGCIKYSRSCLCDPDIIFNTNFGCPRMTQ